MTHLAVHPTRLRIEVANPALVDVAGLYARGAFGVVISGHVVQVVVGAEAPELAQRIEAELKQPAPPAGVPGQLAPA